jgi:hypothetical protein
LVVDKIGDAEEEEDEAAENVLLAVDLLVEENFDDL